MIHLCKQKFYEFFAQKEFNGVHKIGVCRSKMCISIIFINTNAWNLLARLVHVPCGSIAKSVISEKLFSFLFFWFCLLLLILIFFRFFFHQFFFERMERRKRIKKPVHSPFSEGKMMMMMFVCTCIDLYLLRMQCMFLFTQTCVRVTCVCVKGRNT